MNDQLQMLKLRLSKMMEQRDKAYAHLMHVNGAIDLCNTLIMEVEQGAKAEIIKGKEAVEAAIKDASPEVK